MYIGKAPKITSDVYSPMDISRNLLKNCFGMKRYHGPCSEFKDTNIHEYYLSKDENVMVRLSDVDRTVIRSEDMDEPLVFEDVKTFLEEFYENLENVLESGEEDLDWLDITDKSLNKNGQDYPFDGLGKFFKQEV
jgi:hypothetical protein